MRHSRQNLGVQKKKRRKRVKKKTKEKRGKKTPRYPHREFQYCRYPQVLTWPRVGPWTPRQGRTALKTNSVVISLATRIVSFVFFGGVFWRVSWCSGDIVRFVGFSLFCFSQVFYGFYGHRHRSSYFALTQKKKSSQSRRSQRGQRRAPFTFHTFDEFARFIFIHFLFYWPRTRPHLERLQHFIRDD